jgi:chromosome segregation ATPase
MSFEQWWAEAERLQSQVDSLRESLRAKTAQHEDERRERLKLRLELSEARAEVAAIGPELDRARSLAADMEHRALRAEAEVERLREEMVKLQSVASTEQIREAMEALVEAGDRIVARNCGDSEVEEWAEAKRKAGLK